MSTEIDIYADKPVHTIDYMVAIMLAAKAGKKIQFRLLTHYAGLWSPKAEAILTIWNWQSYTYRVDPAEKPKIAEGNNPGHLTEDQVGVKDGWRLVTRDEILHRLDSSPPMTSKAFVWFGGHWATGPVQLINTASTYRTKKPAGYFLPKPKVKVPLTLKEYVGPVIWVRSKMSPSEERMVTDVSHNTNRLLFDGFSLDPQTASVGWEHSTDRINWKPCYKEVEQ